MDISLGWLIIGFLGQIFFSARFILQWIYSEINKKSIIPLGFWFFSILGGITGAGAGAVLSQGDGRWWAIPLGIVTGSMVGCQIDGG